MVHLESVIQELETALSIASDPWVIKILESISISWAWELPLWEISGDIMNLWPHSNIPRDDTLASRLHNTTKDILPMASLVFEAAKKVLNWYKDFCVPNFMDELVSYIMPEYVIGHTYEAHSAASELVQEVRDCLAGKGVSRIERLATYIAGICVGAAYPNTTYVARIISDLQTLGAAACDRLFDIILNQVLMGSTQKLVPLLCGMFNYTVHGDHDTRFGVWRTLLGADDTIYYRHRWGGIPNRGCCDLCIPYLTEVLADMILKGGKNLDADTIHCDMFWLKASSARDAGKVYCCRNIHATCAASFKEVIKNFVQVLPGFMGLQCFDASQKANWVIYYLYGAKLPACLLGNISHKYNLRYNDLLTSGVMLYYTKHKAAYKILDRLYPCSSTTDSTHMVLRLSHLVYSMLNLQHNRNAGDTIVGMSKPIPKVSRSHMCNVVNKVLSKCPIGTIQNIVITFLILYLDADDDETKHLDHLLEGLFRLSALEQINVLKTVSILLRRYNLSTSIGVVSDSFVSKMAYMELSYGRSCFMSDFMTEVKNRTGKTYHLCHPSNAAHFGHSTAWRMEGVAYSKRDPNFYASLRSEIKEIVHDICGHKSTKVSYEEFLTKANDWLASGSAPRASATLNIPDGHGGVQTSEVRVGKRGWAEKLNPRTFSRRIYIKKPIERAVASEKFENGKGRALYGVEPEHYMHSTYATKGLEESLYKCKGLEKGLKGLAAFNMESFRARLTQSPQIHCMMLDYADFNVQHSPESQAIIFEEIAAHHRAANSSRDIIVANEWVAAAKYNMVCNFKPTTRPYKNVKTGKALIDLYAGKHEVGTTCEKKITQGMFSGTRSTDLINTILNLAYFRVADKYVRATLDIKPQALYHTHQGDDVWISTANPEYCAVLYYTINRMGLVTQKHKQMFGSHRGEYLRVLYANGTAMGYLGRAIANFVLKEIQRPLPMDAAANLKMAWDSINTMVRRGLGPLGYSVLWHDQLNHWSKVNEFPGDPRPITIPRKVATAPVECGGLGFLWGSVSTLNRMMYCNLRGVEGGSGYAHWHNYQSKSVPTISVPAQAISKETPSNCTDAWVSNLSQSLYKYGDLRSDVLRTANLCSNYADTISVHWRRSMLRKYKRDMSEWVDAVKADPHFDKIQSDLQECDISQPASFSGYYVPNRDSVLMELLSMADNMKGCPGPNSIHDSVDKSLSGKYRMMRRAWCPLPDKGPHAAAANNHWDAGAMNSVCQAQAFQWGPSVQQVHLHPDHYTTTKLLTDVPETANAILNQVIVRSTTKCLPVLQSALALTKLEAFALLVHRANGFAPEILQTIQHWLKLMQEGKTHLLDIILQSGMRMLGSLDCLVQPSLVLAAYASGASLYTTQSISNVPDTNLALCNASMLLPTLVLVGCLRQSHMKEGLKIAY
ncbi:MAG: RNA-dependent RNA polymerase [Sanya nephotettix cincticeps totivirus 2]|nr:MAG: RNA-dependent RNA polymerase [Sanya nephotettix cincticeps totivirus 2]